MFSRGAGQKKKANPKPRKPPTPARPPAEKTVGEKFEALVFARNKEIENLSAETILIFELTLIFDLVSEPIVFVSMSSIRNWYQT